MNQHIHFTEEEVAMVADAINENRYDHLPETIRLHLSECDECASEVLMVADIAQDFKMEAAKPKTLRLKRWIYIVSVSSAAAILIFTIFKLTQPNGNNHLNQNLLVTTDSVARSIDNSLIESDTTSEIKTNRIEGKNMASLEPNKQLEKLYDNYKTAYRGDDIQIVTKGVVQYSANDSLKWINPGKKTLTVEILDNKGEISKKATSKSQGIKIPNLPKGLYYWKLINEDSDLLYVGKIKN